jgi:hypothetical protein
MTPETSYTTYQRFWWLRVRLYWSLGSINRTWFPENP